MGILRASSGSSVKNPFAAVFTWHNKEGNWFGIEPDPEDVNPPERYIVDAITGFIVEPSLYKITGKKRNTEISCKSNYCLRKKYDTLHVITTQRVGNSQSINPVGSGEWRDESFQSVVKGWGGRWTKVVAFYLQSATVHPVDGQGQRSGQSEIRKFNKLVELRMRGDAIRLGWGALENTTGVKTYDLDGYYVKQAGTIDKDGEYKYPEFKARPLNPDNPKEQEIIDMLIKQHGEIMEYLEDHWANLNQQHQETPLQSNEQQKSVSAPPPSPPPPPPPVEDVTTGSSESGDDLPF